MNAKEGGKEFTRKELYDLLTDMPVRRIAQEYDLDIPSLTKCIDTFNIPRRQSGDWTKISMGWIIEREPLSGNPNELVFVSSSLPKPNPKKNINEEYEYPILPVVSDTSSKPMSIESTATEDKFAIPPSASTSAMKSPPKPEIKPIFSWACVSPRPSKNASSAYLSKKKKSQSTARINNSSKAHKRLEKYNQDKSLYEILEIVPSDDYQKISLFELQLSVRSINALMRERLDTLHKVMSQSLAYLLEIRNLGSMSVESIMDTCKKYCLRHPAKKEQNQEIPIAALQEIPNAINAEAHTENSIKSQQFSSDIESPFVKLMMEFFKLNSTGKEIVLELIKAMAKMDRFKA